MACFSHFETAPQLADHYPLPVVKMSLGIDPQADAGVSS